MTSSKEVGVGPVDDFPIGELKLIVAGNREVGVVRRADGSVQAVRNWCPHKGAQICKSTQPTGTMLPGAPGTLTWGKDGEILRCPWHGFEFDIRTGERPFSESKMRLRVYPARIENGEILIDLGPQRSKESTT